MADRPELDKKLDAATFRSYYFRKEELTAFCRANGLPAAGGKEEIAERIACFLDTGNILSSAGKRRSVAAVGELREDTLIESPFVCSEMHRAFFREKIGKSFSFLVPFQSWLKENAGKTYGDAIAAYRRIVEEKRSGTSVIDRQFEYNTYIRDFFADNEGKSLEDAIRCWKYRKGLQGKPRYRRDDLAVLSGSGGKDSLD